MLEKMVEENSSNIEEIISRIVNRISYVTTNIYFSSYNIKDFDRLKSNKRVRNHHKNVSSPSFFENRKYISMNRAVQILREDGHSPDVFRLVTNTNIGRFILEDESNKIIESRTRSLSLRIKQMPELKEDLKLFSDKLSFECSDLIKREYDSTNYLQIEKLIMASDLKSLAKETKGAPKLLVQEIVKYINEIHDVFYFKGKLRIPIMTPQKVSFNPFSVTWKKIKRFDGNPLAFFQKHLAIYGDLTRGELKDVDESLYQSLRYKNQLELAIPEQYCETEKKKKDELILSSLIKTNGKLMKTANKTNSDFYRVKRIAQDHQVKLFKDRTYTNYNLSDREVKRVLKLWNYDVGAVEKVKQLTGHCTKTITGIWKAHGLRVARNKKTPSEIREINESYKLTGTYRGTARFLGIEPETVSTYHKKSESLSQIINALLYFKAE